MLTIPRRDRHRAIIGRSGGAWDFIGPRECVMVSCEMQIIRNGRNMLYTFMGAQGAVSLDRKLRSLLK